MINKIILIGLIGILLLLGLTLKVIEVKEFYENNE